MPKCQISEWDRYKQNLAPNWNFWHLKLTIPIEEMTHLSVNDLKPQTIKNRFIRRHCDVSVYRTINNYLIIQCKCYVCLCNYLNKVTIDLMTSTWSIYRCIDLTVWNVNTWIFLNLFESCLLTCIYMCTEIMNMKGRYKLKNLCDCRVI